MVELKPCPFCGRTPNVEEYRYHSYFVRCKCGIEQSRFYWDECDAVKHWNTREDEPWKGDSVSKRYLLAEIDDLADEFSEVDENGLHSERWCGILDSRGIIVNAPSMPDRPQEWIPCSERNPEKNGEYLITLGFEWGREIEIGFYEDGKWLNDNRHVNIAWKPLPKPWKGADDE